MYYNALQNNTDVKEKTVYFNRTAKVVKGGQKPSFSVIVIAGDEKGRVGFGFGKAKEVIEAQKKAARSARENLIRIPLRDGRTIHHISEAKSGSGKVLIRPAPPGTGVIAGGIMRSVFELLGIRDVVAKSLGSTNPHNMIKATLTALQNSFPPRVIAEKRGMKISDIVGQRESASNKFDKVVRKAEG